MYDDLGDREIAYRLAKTVKEEFELSKAYLKQLSSLKSSCDRHMNYLRSNDSAAFADQFQQDLVRSGVMDENGFWELIKI